MNASVTWGRGDEAPVVRLKAPVKIAVVPLVLGAQGSVRDGIALRAGATLPWGLAWRVSGYPWRQGPARQPTVRLKYPINSLGGSLSVGAELDLRTGAVRFGLRAKPQLGAFTVAQLGRGVEGGFSARRLAAGGAEAAERALEPPAEVSVRAHTAVPLGRCQWAQFRWEVSAPADALAVEGSGRDKPLWPGLVSKPWLRVRLNKLSILRIPDRQSARQTLCGACMRAPIVREQTPAVRGGLSLNALAAAYSRTRIEDASVPLQGLRRDLLTDLKAVTLAHWITESGNGTCRLATHHCNYGRMAWRDDLGGLAAPVRIKGRKDQLQGVFCSFDSAQDFFTATWRELGDKALSRESDVQALESATSSDGACDTFLKALTDCGVVTEPERVHDLIPEARRLLAQGRESAGGPGWGLGSIVGGL